MASRRLPRDVAAEVTEIVHGYMDEHPVLIAGSAHSILSWMRTDDPDRTSKLDRLMRARPDLKPRIRPFIDSIVEYRGSRAYKKGCAPETVPCREVMVPADDADLGIRPSQGRMPFSLRR